MAWDGKEQRRDYQQNLPDLTQKLEDLTIGIANLTHSIHSHIEQYKLDYKRHQDSLEKHEEAIYGNGKRGLNTRAEASEIELASLRKHHFNLIRDVQLLTRSVFIGMGVLSALTFIARYVDLSKLFQ